MPDASDLQSVMKKDSEKQRATVEKQVSFSNLDVYEFLIMIGDNPSCEGAPLCLSGEMQGQSTHSVDKYEASRKGRRDRKKLTISASKRSRLLMALGYSMEDIASAALETQKVRQEREETLGNQKWDKFTYVFESASRKLKKIVGKTKPPSVQSTIASRSA